LHLANHPNKSEPTTLTVMKKQEKQE